MIKRVLIVSLMGVSLAGCVNNDSLSGDVYTASEAKQVQNVTYGTSLYKETGDIYLVADVLGHKDVNTTKKHYAAIDEDRRRQAANIVKLREV